MTTTIKWFGHAALSMNTAGKQLLLDPYFTGNSQTKQDPGQVSADYILITHGHGDHVGDALAIASRTGAILISNAEICAWFAAKGIKTHAQHLGGGFHYPFGYLKLTFALWLRPARWLKRGQPGWVPADHAGGEKALLRRRYWSVWGYEINR